MGLLDGRRLLLGVGGGIAAYKAPELVRRLREAGASVRVVLTDAGAEFVSALALEVVSEAPVGRGLWGVDAASHIVHTDLGKDVDLIVLAPATANLIGRIRHGLADDLLTTTVMACHTPVLVCPSMNTEMLGNPLVRENIEALGALERYTLLEPGTGLLACGVVGPGRLPDPPEIVEAIAAALTPPLLLGVRVTVSAGPTRESLDPVRFLTNRSSGTMGYALARAFAAYGATVTLVSGPSGLRTPVGVARRIDITSALDAAEAIEGHFGDTDVLVMAAAVADYRPAASATDKLKKGAGPMRLDLERTTDILASVAGRADRAGRLLVGFAAETRDIEAQARGKLDRKDLDWIVANDVSGVGVGFGSGDNAGLLIARDGSVAELPRASKDAFAERIVALLAPAILERLARA